MHKKRELDYAELKAEYNKLINDIEAMKLMSYYNENKKLKQELENSKRLIVKLQRRNRELSLLLNVLIVQLFNIHNRIMRNWFPLNFFEKSNIH